MREAGPEGMPLGLESASLTSTGKIPDPLSFWRAATVLSASRMPFLVFPDLSRAVYSYTGIIPPAVLEIYLGITGLDHGDL